MSDLNKILTLTDHSIQFWLRTVDEQDVLNGMLGVSAQVRDRVMTNLSGRAKVAMRDYLEAHANLDPRIVETSLERLEKSLLLIR